MQKQIKTKSELPQSKTGKCYIMRIEMADDPKRGDVYWVCLDPTLGKEINKAKPAVIISNNAGNEVGFRLIVAPITSSLLTKSALAKKLQR